MNTHTSPDSRRPAIPVPASRLGRILAAIRRIIGAPDYDAYVDHVRRCHPGHEPLSREQFVAHRLSTRYNTPGSRCC